MSLRTHIHGFICVVSFLFSVLCTPQPLCAQTPSDIINLPHTPIKNQYNSGTCWSFAGVSFLESEIIRKGGVALDLSEMYVVSKCYVGKAEMYIRMHQALHISEGGEMHDVLWAVSRYGIMPRTEYGANSAVANQSAKVEGALLGALANLSAPTSNSTMRVPQNWASTVDSIIDSYMGTPPTTFSYQGVTYTPRQFAEQVVQFTPSDYVGLTSFSHHPYYEPFVLEVPDNWLMGSFYNVPVDLLQQAVDTALARGYTVAWGADISEATFSYSTGIATYADSKVDNDIRQQQFDNYDTTDDHGMHIVGLARDSLGTLYYKVKNSWGTRTPNRGYLYVTIPYYRAKTIDILLHKDALPASLRRQLRI